MKKQVIAAAVAAAFAVPAMAQVTVSGLIDAGYASKSVADGTKQAGIAGNIHSTSNFTLSGTEDLGGGLRAGFRITQEFNPGTGLVTGQGNTATGAALDATGTAITGTAHTHTYTLAKFQTATVGVSGGFGSINMGTMAHATRDAGGVYRFFGDFGRLPRGYNSPDARENTIEYVSPTVSGFSVSAASSDAGKTTATANAAHRMVSMGVRGSVQKLNVALGNESYRTAAGVKTVFTNIAASYDLGVARIGYVNVKRKQDADDAYVANVAQVAVPFGGAWLLGLGYGVYTDKVATGGESKQTSLMAQYGMSKRTTVYATAQTLQNKTASGMPSLSSANAGGALGLNSGLDQTTRGLGVSETAGASRNGFAIGVRHTF